MNVICTFDLVCLLGIIVTGSERFMWKKQKYVFLFVFKYCFGGVFFENSVTKLIFNPGLNILKLDKVLAQA